MTTGDTMESLIGQAIDWLLQIDEAPDDESVRAAAEAWRTATPEHARAWARAEKAHGLLARPANEPVIAAVPSRQAAYRRSRARLWTAGVVAALAACLLLAYAPGVSQWLRADFVTQTAELRQVTLEDGTVVQLAPQTALNVRFDDARRRVTLLAGQAFFEVVPQPDRPFEVRAADHAVTVLGTAFDVALSDDALSIGVQHGTVEVRAVREDGSRGARLGQGDQLIVRRHDGAILRTKVPPEEVASWRDHRLFVESATVADVVEELRRYGVGWVVFADMDLARQQVTGLYDLSEPDRALRALVGPFGGRVREVTPLLKIVSGP